MNTEEIYHICCRVYSDAFFIRARSEDEARKKFIDLGLINSNLLKGCHHNIDFNEINDKKEWNEVYSNIFSTFYNINRIKIL